MATSYGFTGPRIVRDGLVLYLDAANPNSYNLSAPLDWRDISGNRSNGTLINGAAFATINGGSILYDGTDDNVSIADNAIIDLNDKITLAIWIKLNVNLSNQIDHIGLISKEEYFVQTGYRLSFRTDQSGDPLNFRVNGQASDNICQWGPDNFFNDLKWHYVVATYDRSILRLNVDLIERASGGYTSAINLNNASLAVGSRLNGNIGMVKIYNRAISQAEITQNFNATRGRFGV